MKTTATTSASTIYSVRIGSEECLVRGFEIESIDSIFSDASAKDRSAAENLAPWSDVTGPDELVAERMAVPPAVRKRSRLVASRARLLNAAGRD